MKHRPLFLFAAALLTLFTAPTLRAQDLYVGYDSSGVSTNLTSGTNSYSAIYIGYWFYDSNNTLSVYNAGTLLNVVRDIYVGDDGADNSLVVSNGGKVAGWAVFIGNGSASSNNSVLVTGGSSSLLLNTDLNVGNDGSGNSLVISNSGSVQNYNSSI